MSQAELGQLDGTAEFNFGENLRLAGVLDMELFTPQQLRQRLQLGRRQASFQQSKPDFIEVLQQPGAALESALPVPAVPPSLVVHGLDRQHGVQRRDGRRLADLAGRPLYRLQQAGKAGAPG